MAGPKNLPGFPGLNTRFDHMSKLKVVLVGCGGFARNYLPIYRNLPDVECLLCVDANLAAAQSMRETLGATYADDQFQAAVEADADYAVISTPNHLHTSQASALLESGKSVLLQKPMAPTLADASRLHELCQSLDGVQLGMYMSMLDFPFWWHLREAMRTRDIVGNVTQVSMRLGHTGGLAWSNEKNPLWRFSREKTGGGAFIMLGVHYLHFVRWLLGLRIIRVCAQTENLHCPRIEGEDICQIQAELDHGIMLQLSVAWNSQGEHFAVYGTKGSVVYLDNELLRIHGAESWSMEGIDYSTPVAWQNFTLTPPRLDDAANSFNQHLQFARALKEKKPFPVPATEGLLDMQITDAVYRSAASHQWEDVPNV